jgi:hypothetical protein
MDAALMRESVPAHDRLVVLHREGRGRRDDLGGAIQHRRLDAGLEREGIAARFQRHHDFFQRRIARALANAVDGALDLPRTAHHAGDGICHRHAEIVVAMH